jgi:predicted ATPase
MTVSLTKQQAMIERLHIQNYRVLRDVQLSNLTPLTVLLGANGSGKSTVFDVFAFLHEAFTTNLRSAWDHRNRIRELRSRGGSGPITIEIAYRPHGAGLVTYRLELDEENGSPVVVGELLHWATSPGSGAPTDILNFQRGEGRLYDDESKISTDERLDSPDLLAVSTLGGLARYPWVAHLRRFVSGWYLSYLSGGVKRAIPEAGPQARLSENGDNLPNVIQYLSEQHPDRLGEILRVLADRVPQLQRVDTELLADGRLLLRFKDAPFDESVLAKYASDGTLKLLAYLTVLYGPEPPPIVGIEEPENFLHPRLLPILAEEAREAAGRSQLLVTTHSPYFVDALRPKELWVLYKDDEGFSRTIRASDMRQVVAQADAGGLLGNLWMEGYFEAGDPLVRGGRPKDVGQRVNLEILVEERSAERALDVLLPRIVPGVDFEIRVFRGKPDLLKKLPDRLKGYAGWITQADTCLAILVDRDNDDCLTLKSDMEKMAAAAGLLTVTVVPEGRLLCVVNRIAVEELEAWFFGDVPALCAAYARVPASLGEQAKYRDPDAIVGGTSEALERVLQAYGYHPGGLAKIVAAAEIAQHMNVDANRSRSFQVFRDGVRRLIAGGTSAAEN